MASSTVLTLLVIPAVYSLWRQREVRVAAEKPVEQGGSAATEGENLGVVVA
jgi:hypothetical protein